MARAFLRRTIVESITGLSRTTIYRLMAEGKFPKAVTIGGRAVGWVEEEIHEWIDQRIESSRTVEAKKGDTL